MGKKEAVKVHNSSLGLIKAPFKKVVLEFLPPSLGVNLPSGLVNA